jgi:vanillate monooxygenase ferredoxin subunit
VTDQSLMRVQVRRKKRLSSEVFLFELFPIEGGVLPRFTAGAHIDVEVAPGKVRSYSLCNSASSGDRYQIAVLREFSSRGGSVAMHDAVHEGHVIRISKPKNYFLLRPGRHQSLLLAGGIGVTPLLSMAEQLDLEGASFSMHYCTRTAEHAAFREYILQTPFANKVTFHADNEDSGRLFNLSKVLAEADSDAHLYVCGPGGFIKAVCSTAKAAGWSQERIHFEAFSTELPGDTSSDFDVLVASSGQRVRVSSNFSIAQALSQAGISVPVSCEQGVCGTCKTVVLDGVPDHRDLYLTDDEKDSNKHILLCCSRALSSSLVLDI